MKLTSLLQLVDKLQQAGKIDNLQQVCDVFGCVSNVLVQKYSSQEVSCKTWNLESWNLLALARF